jgi:hypothetical protein
MTKKVLEEGSGDWLQNFRDNKCVLEENMRQQVMDKVI